MAQYRYPAFFAVAALLLLAAVAPLALAQVPPAQLLPPVQLPLGQLINMIQINGELCCTPTGTCPGGPGLAGVNYTMSCRIGTLGSGSGSLVAAFGSTGINGGFTVNLTNTVPTLLSTLGITIADLLAGRVLPCQILIDLPFDRVQCATLSLATGTLTGFLQLVRATVTAVGIVLTYVVTFGGGLPLALP